MVYLLKIFFVAAYYMDKEFLKIVPSSKTASPKAKTASPKAKTASPKAKTASPKAKTASPKAKTASPKAKTASKVASKTASKSASYSSQGTSQSPRSRTRSKLYNPYEKQWVPIATDDGLRLRKLVKQCEKCPKKGEFYDSSSKKCVSRGLLQGNDLEISNFCEVYKREMHNRTEQDIRIINNILESRVEVTKGQYLPIKDIANLTKEQLDQRIRRGDTGYAVLKISNAVGRMLKDNPRLGDKVRDKIIDNLKNVDKGFAALFFTIFKKNIRGNVLKLFSYLSFTEITAILAALFGGFWKVASFLVAKFPRTKFLGKKVRDGLEKLQHNMFPSSTIDIIVPNSKNEIISLLQDHNYMTFSEMRKSDAVYTVPVNRLGLTDSFIQTLGNGKITIDDYSHPRVGLFKDIVVYSVSSNGHKFKITLGNDRLEITNRIKKRITYAIKGSQNLVEIVKRYNEYQALLSRRDDHVRALHKNKNSTKIIAEIRDLDAQIGVQKHKYGDLFSLYKIDKGRIFMQNPGFIKPLEFICENVTEYNVNYYLNRMFETDNDASLIKLYSYIHYTYQKSQGKKIKMPAVLFDTKKDDIEKWVSNGGVISQNLSQNIQNTEKILKGEGKPPSNPYSTRTIGESYKTPHVPLKRLTPGESYKHIVPLTETQTKEEKQKELADFQARVRSANQPSHVWKGTHMANLEVEQKKEEQERNDRAMEMVSELLGSTTPAAKSPPIELLGPSTTPTAKSPPKKLIKEL